MEVGPEKTVSDGSEWVNILEEERLLYETLYFSQGPVDGYILGEGVTEFFLKSGLSLRVLSQIWNLADVSRDNVLNVHEFCLVLHLIRGLLQGLKLPSTLPRKLTPPKTELVPFQPATAEEKEAYTRLFHALDTEGTGDLDDSHAKEILLASGLAAEVLARVWNLSDVNKDGKLDAEEFCLACHLIRFVKAGNSLSGPVDVFTMLPDRVAPQSLQSRKQRIEKYEQQKQKLMNLKEKRKLQVIQESRRQQIQEEKIDLLRQVHERRKEYGLKNMAEEKFNENISYEKDELEKLEEIVYRLKKEHEKIRQETVRIILSEKNQNLSNDIFTVKKDTDELNKRLSSCHNQATKDPDPFHQLYEQRKVRMESDRWQMLLDKEEGNVGQSWEEVEQLREKINSLNAELHQLNPSGTRLVFKNPEDYLLKKKILEEEAKSDRSNFNRRSLNSDRRSGLPGSPLGQSSSGNSSPRLRDRSFFTERNQDVSQAVREYRLKRHSLQFPESSLLSSDKSSQNSSGKVLEEVRTSARRSLPRQNTYSGSSSSVPDPEEGKDLHGSAAEVNGSNANIQSSETNDDPASLASSSLHASIVTNSEHSVDSKDSSPKTSDVHKSVSPDKTPDKSVRKPSAKKTPAPPPPQRDSEVSVITSLNTSFPVSFESKKSDVFTDNATTPNPEESRSVLKNTVVTKSVVHTSLETSLGQNVTTSNQSHLSSQSGHLAESDSLKETTIVSIVSAEVHQKLPETPVRPKRKRDSKHLSGSASPRDEVAPALQQKVEKVDSQTDSSYTSPFQTSSGLEENHTCEEEHLNADGSIVVISKTSHIGKNYLVSEDGSVPATKDTNALVKTNLQKEDLKEIQPLKSKQSKGKSPDPPKLSAEFKPVEEVPALVDVSSKKSQITSKPGIPKKPELDKTAFQIKSSRPVHYLDLESQSISHLNAVTYQKSEVDKNLHKTSVTPDKCKTENSQSFRSDANSTPPPLPESEPPPLPASPPPNLHFRFGARSTEGFVEGENKMEENGMLEIDSLLPDCLPEINMEAQMMMTATHLQEDILTFKQQEEKPAVEMMISESHELEDEHVIQVKSENHLSVTSDNLISVDVGLSGDSDISCDERGQEGIFSPGENDVASSLPTAEEVNENEVQLVSHIQSEQLPAENKGDDFPAEPLIDVRESFDSALGDSLPLVNGNQPPNIEAENSIEDPELAENSIEDPELLTISGSLTQQEMAALSPRSREIFEKARHFAEMVQKPNFVARRENSADDSLSQEALQDLELERRAAISESTVRRRDVEIASPTKETTDLIDTADYASSSQTSYVDQSSQRPSSPEAKWEEKCGKISLYSDNVVQEPGSTENVDRESIANLATTRHQWENAFVADTTKDTHSTLKKSPPKWEVRIPYKEKIPTGAAVIKSPSAHGEEEEEEEKGSHSAKMVDVNSTESAIEREIRYAMEREIMLKKELEERMNLLTKQQQGGFKSSSMESSTESDFRPSYHELTEADRGSEVMHHEKLALQEDVEREEALRRTSHSASHTQQTYHSDEEKSNENVHESIVEREIRLQREREAELAQQRGYASPTYQKPSAASPRESSSSSHDKEVITVVKSAPPQEISYEDAISHNHHEGESLIARELRELREREEEMKQLRDRLNVKVSSPENKVPVSHQTSQPAVQQQHPHTSGSTSQSEKHIIVENQTPHKASTVNVHGKISSTSAPQPNNSKLKQETPIEREIRLARERENELRRAKGLPELPSEPQKQESVEESAPVVNESNSQWWNPSPHPKSTIQNYASNRLQQEILAQKELELKLREEGKIITTSEEHIRPLKYSEITGQDKVDGTIKRNFKTPNRKSSTVTPDSPQDFSALAQSDHHQGSAGTSSGKKGFGTGGVSFSYKEFKQTAESKIERELREMREREDELRQRRSHSGNSAVEEHSLPIASSQNGPSVQHATAPGRVSIGSQWEQNRKN